MSPFETQDMAAALLATNGAHATNEAVEKAAAAKEHGWIAPTPFDYEQYVQSDAFDKDIAAGVGHVDGAWAADAARYEWDGEEGDIGPEHPELEKALFGSEDHVRSGIDFDKIAEISVTQEGPIQIAPVRQFEEAGLHPAMLRNVKLAGYDRPTPIQAYCIPAVMKGHDVIACAQTGSGKTAAFLVPVLSKLMGKAKKLCAPRPNPATMDQFTEIVRAEPLVLIVCPTRELATQIFDEARRFCYRTMFRPCVIYGGGPRGEQAKELRKGCDILIGTPGRLCDFIGDPALLSLHRLKYMIIDEADEMVGPDWETELKTIMSGGDQEEGNLIYMMFSATFPKVARQLAKEHLAHEHVRIRVGRAGSSHVNITQKVIFVDPSSKRQACTDLLLHMPPTRTIIFVNSKRTADEIDDYLFNTGFPCTSIHSDRTQREREDALRAFRTGKCPIMIATGVSARGLDIRNIMHVINYDLPQHIHGGIQEYIHRIGRTGRIGNKGLATSFYNDKDCDLAGVLVKTLLDTKQEIPDFLEQYLPEGFETGAEKTGAELNWDDNSDDDMEEEAGDQDEVAAGGDFGDAAEIVSDGEAGSSWGADSDAGVDAVEKPTASW